MKRINHWAMLAAIAAAPTLQALAQNNKPQVQPVTWFSIPSDNMARTSAFYQSAFGWTIMPETKEKNDLLSYRVAVTAEGSDEFVPDQKGIVNGCIVKRGIGLPAPGILIEVGNLDDAIRKVLAAGGTQVTEKMPIPTLNAIFVLIKDTEGNIVEVFQPLRAK